MEELTHQMRALLGGLVTFTGLGLQANGTNFEWLDLSKVLQKVLEDHKKQIEEQKAMVEWEKIPWQMRGNKAHLELLFTQLLQNKFEICGRIPNPGNFDSNLCRSR